VLKKVFIAGGGGFIGGHFVERLLASAQTEQVTVYDNFPSGRNKHLESLMEGRLEIVASDIKNLTVLTKAMTGHDTVIHLASNPDIARAATEPMIDFDQGTLLTQLVVEAMRRTSVKQILYASGSGVYGDTGLQEAAEDFAPMVPISTYGASKLAGEGLIAAYAHMFGISGIAFRFGNVVGPRQTHGVGLDFINKLKDNPKTMEILGDGSQSKSYVYISDIMDAVLLAATKADTPFNVFNVATGDYLTVNEIAQIAIEKVLGPKAETRLTYTGGDRGWKGDVPIVRLNTERIRALGWKPTHNSRQSMERSIEDMLACSNDNKVLEA
jgi:UDP-glucose 4-epimerase